MSGPGMTGAGMTPQDYELLAALAKVRAGLKIDPAKTYLIDSRLAPLARRENFGAIADMVLALRAMREERLIWAVVEALTFNDTAFYRDRIPFRQFRDEVLPALSRLRGPGPLRVWSAGCATGQEAYSLAMAADDIQGLTPGSTVEVYGSDLSERCLEKAQSGLYTQFEVQRGLPIRQLLRHFEQVDDQNWRISPRIRQKIRWRRVNLLTDLGGSGRFDIIFCRNVISGLDQAARKTVLEGLAALLPEDGFLWLGVNEAAIDSTQAFKAIPGRPGLYARNPAFKVAA
ncbi:chemotaxis protein methyltransferase CheR [Caulobacter ginsengisoli]|uniref:protein-glutamate O-methyltransferase n=1 Tax=Caulobacter ginsengisoli TaxID=400775 RepID=A0ABU0ISC1_9CAUL|nr:protein-glutamate O-methyltransferase CheR [Caulobacter ginsengisoli]MDQ0464900.1 chemotaxis protein methyltransferase CheR [Caulobacter ginsengisoli]